MKIFASTTSGVVWGALLAFIGTFVFMFLLAGLVDVIVPAGPGPGAMVFYLSFILSPVGGVVGGIWGARLAKRQTESAKKQTEATHADATQNGNRHGHN